MIASPVDFAIFRQMEVGVPVDAATASLEDTIAGT